MSEKNEVMFIISVLDASGKAATRKLIAEAGKLDQKDLNNAAEATLSLMVGHWNEVYGTIEFKP